jgi:hypothetical protein
MFRNTIIRTTKRNFTTTRAFQKIIPEATQTTPGKRPAEMDSNSGAKSMDKGAASTGTSVCIFQLNFASISMS